MTSSSASIPRARTPRVALFGYYQYRNFGDDLMAVIFGRTLQSLNIPFRVYRLNATLLDEFGFEGADSIERLLEDASAVVYGGGGAFLTTRVSEYEAALTELRERCALKGIPIYMFSVGGDGQPYEQIAQARRELLQTASFVSFRNREDQVLLDRIGPTRGAIHDDIVWQTRRLFPVAKIPNRMLTVGIDSALFYDADATSMLRVLQGACKVLRRPYRFVTIIQSGAPTGFDREEGCIQFRNGLQQFISEIVEADVIITPRLHLGMVAMSFDIPTLSLMPLAKAALLFNRLGLKRLIFPSKRSLPRFLALMLNERGLRSLRPSSAISELDQIVEDSKRHLTDLERMLSVTIPRASNLDNQC